MIRTVKRARQAHQKAIEQFYEDICTVYEYKSIKDEITKITSKKEVAVLEGQPCKLSFESLDTANGSSNAAEKRISVKLFISLDVAIKAGSKIVVTHMGEITAYCSSGVPGKFSTHQEIRLELFERWA